MLSCSQFFITMFFIPTFFIPLVIQITIVEKVSCSENASIAALSEIHVRTCTMVLEETSNDLTQGLQKLEKKDSFCSHHKFE